MGREQIEDENRQPGIKKPPKNKPVRQDYGDPAQCINPAKRKHIHSCFPQHESEQERERAHATYDHKLLGVHLVIAESRRNARVNAGRNPIFCEATAVVFIDHAIFQA